MRYKNHGYTKTSIKVITCNIHTMIFTYQFNGHHVCQSRVKGCWGPQKIQMGPFNISKQLGQLCPSRGPVEGFVRPSLGFRCSKRILYTDNLSLF